MAQGHCRRNDPMDTTLELIQKVKPLDYKKVIIETDSKRYYADLSEFDSVHCFPKSPEWSDVSIDSDGIDLIWGCRFEVHVNQVIDCAYKVEDLFEVS
jgi:hypothetical protein